MKTQLNLAYMAIQNTIKHLAALNLQFNQNEI